MTASGMADSNRKKASVYRMGYRFIVGEFQEKATLVTGDFGQERCLFGAEGLDGIDGEARPRGQIARENAVATRPRGSSAVSDRDRRAHFGIGATTSSA